MPSLTELIQRVKLVAFDFDGVFTDNAVYTFEDGREAVRSWRGDGLGIKRLAELGIDVVIITSEPQGIADKRASKLGVKIAHATGGLTKYGCLNKSRDIVLRRTGQDAEYENIAYVGNDINDLDCLKAVGLPIVVSDAHPDVVAYGKYRTRARGGYGAVREVCDLFAEVLSASPS